MSYQKDRDEFIGVIVEECAGADAQANYRKAVLPENRTGSAVDLARLILRNATTIRKLAVKACNEQLTDYNRRQDSAAQARIRAACLPWGIKPTFNGDPRGACVKLILPSGKWNSLGGAEDGFCVPTR